jgi:hypothetical protein
MMTTDKPTPAAGEAVTVAERRAFMALPLDERRRRLLAQVTPMVAYYHQEPERAERLAWQGGDIAEP